MEVVLSVIALIASRIEVVVLVSGVIVNETVFVSGMGTTVIVVSGSKNIVLSWSDVSKIVLVSGNEGVVSIVVLVSGTVVVLNKVVVLGTGIVLVSGTEVVW